MTDEWAEMPRQRIGVEVDDATLLKLYRDSIVNYAKN